MSDKQSLGRHPWCDRPHGHAADPAHRGGSRARARRCTRAGRASRSGRRRRHAGRGCLRWAWRLNRRCLPIADARRHDRLLAAGGLSGDRRACARSARFRWSSAPPDSTRPSARSGELRPSGFRSSIAPNMSRAVNLLMRLVREAARALGEAGRHRHHRTPSPHQERRSQRHRPSTGRIRAAGPGRRGHERARPVPPAP